MTKCNNLSLYKKLERIIREIYGNESSINLHEPQFSEEEQEALKNVILSTYVSSAGKEIGLFESRLKNYINSSGVVSVVNGTAALHASLSHANVSTNDYVITQPLTFVATCNAIKYVGAEPIFIDIDESTLGLSPESLNDFLERNADLNSENECIFKKNKKKIKAILPMHTFGHPCKIDEIVKISKAWNLTVIEDCAESLGSFYKDSHTGTFGDYGTLSFNGNKVITTGGGGAILVNENKYFNDLKHLVTTAKVKHPYKFIHDRVGFNYRLPNLNAALGLEQLKKLSKYLKQKRIIADFYRQAFKDIDEFKFFWEPADSKSNFWLNTFMVNTYDERESLIKHFIDQGIMLRPSWELMPNLPMYKDCVIHDGISNARRSSEQIVNLPSSPINI